MESHHAERIPLERASTRSRRASLVSLVGPVTVAAGFVWGILQPHRVTLLHPSGQGFWWLVLEPPLLVAVAGLVFALVVARPLIADLEERDAAAR